MPITVNQTAQTAPGGGPATFPISFSATPTVGRAVILVVGANGDVAISSVADNQGGGNTYSRVAFAADSSGGGNHSIAEIWWCPSIVTASGTFTVTATPTTPAEGANFGAGLLEVSGLSGSVDKTGTANDGTGTVTTISATASGANANPGDLVIAIVNCSSQATDFSVAPSSGYTGLAIFSGGSNGISTTAGYKVLSGIETSAVSASWTTGGYASAVVATFLPSASSIATLSWIRA